MSIAEDNSRRDRGWSASEVGERPWSRRNGDVTPEERFVILPRPLEEVAVQPPVASGCQPALSAPRREHPKSATCRALRHGWFRSIRGLPPLLFLDLGSGVRWP